jgi:hypothetical protein
MHTCVLVGRGNRYNYTCVLVGRGFRYNYLTPISKISEPVSDEGGARVR